MVAVKEKMDMRKKSEIIFTVLKVGILLAIVIVTLLPFINMISVSLSSDIYIIKNQVGLIPKGFNLKAYSMVLNDQRIINAYFNTVVQVLLGTSIAILVTSAAAFALSREKMLFGKGFMLMIVFTMYFGGGMIPTYIVIKSLGMIDTIWSVILPGCVTGWNLLLLRVFFMNVPKELDEARVVDGMGDIRAFFHIFLPLSKAALATFILFFGVSYWNQFFGPMIYLQDQKKMPLQVVLRSILISNDLKMNGMMHTGDSAVIIESLKNATIIVSVIPIMIVYPFIQKYFVKGVMIGAVKG